MLNKHASIYLPAIETELRQRVETCGGAGLDPLRHMLAYHMGWEPFDSNKPENQTSGKRVRPLLVLLACASSGGEWRCALPAAAAVELIHNFSLIHDDIEDNSPLRRGRPTVWKLWGIPQALNAGDAMFTLAHLAVLGLEAHLPGASVLKAARLLQETCLHLTQGQYLDISYEGCTDLTLADYWPMVSGKTAALLRASAALGALAAGNTEDRVSAYADFGRGLGLAFQALDDMLGIWGDAALTGKSAESDLVSGKKSLPVLYGLEKNGEFARRWRQGPIQPEQVAELARLLDGEGGRAYAQEQADLLTTQALEALDRARPEGEAGIALRELAAMLLERKA